MTLVGAGYGNPANIRVSPGQITTIFVSGLTRGFAKSQVATTLPLPTTLAGISVTINQTVLKLSFVAPLLSVDQVYLCGPSAFGESPFDGPPSLFADCLVTAITLQVPFELSSSGDFSAPLAEAVVRVNGVNSKPFALRIVPDNLHVLNTCDSFTSRESAQPNVGVECRSVVNHADGTPVNVDSPANPGETIVIYAYGLGQTSPAVKTGEATPTPAPVLGSVLPYNATRTVTVQFDFRPNASPSRPYVVLYDPLDPSFPQFVGLTPGQVGLYQINVRLPSAFPPVQRCLTAEIGTGNRPLNPPIESNLTINVGGGGSFDGAAICVEPPK